MFDEAQIKCSGEFVSFTVAATVQKQQATASATTASLTATGTATATTLSLNDGPSLKVELRTFSGQEAHWDEWHKVYSSKIRIFGFADELVATDEIRVEDEDFNSRGIGPLRAKRASEVGLSLATN